MCRDDTPKASAAAETPIRVGSGFTLCICIPFENRTSNFYEDIAEVG